MHLIHDMRSWSHEHIHWPHMADIKLNSDKLFHSPIFWLMVALVAFLAVMIIMSLFATGGGSEAPLPTPYYPFGGGHPVSP